MSDFSIKINRNKFYNALQTVSRAISSNSPIPSLSGIRIDAENDNLIVTGSDNNFSIEVTLNNASDPDLGLSIIDEGSIVIDSRYLMDVVKKLDSDVISIEIIDGSLTHFGGERAEFKINGFRSEDYPNVDFSEPEIKLEIKCSLLDEIVTETAFAASPKETRPVLTGVNLKEDGTKLVCTATDSYRLSRKTVEIASNPFTVTVPAKALNEAKNIFGTEGTVELAVSEKKVQIRSGSVIVQSSLLDGSYPETDRLIPSEFSRTLIINRQAFISAIDRTNFIRTDNMPVIRLQINSADDITMTNKNQEIGESLESLTAEHYEGDPLDISFSGQYGSEAARALSTENIRIQFNGEMKPFILTNENGDDSILQLVLPVRTYN